MKYLKISIGIFLILIASRFIPHPPNFTSLIAISFYVPAVFGRKFIPAIIAGFLLTDLIIGFHNVILFTWGSVIIIGLISNYFKDRIFSRLIGSFLGTLIFFVISNYGYYFTGYYGYGLEALVQCYLMAIPFFGFSILSTFVFSLIIELLIKIKKVSRLSYINE